MSGKRIDDLPDHTVQGFWEAHQKGEIAVENVLDEIIAQSASRLAEKGYWMWMSSLVSRLLRLFAITPPFYQP